MFGGKGGAGSFNVYDTYEERLGWEESSIYTQKKAEWKFVSALLLYFFTFADLHFVFGFWLSRGGT